MIQYLITNGLGLYLKGINGAVVWTENRDEALRMTVHTAADTVRALTKYGYSVYIVEA